MSELTIKCKYCRANTVHKFTGKTERNSITGQLYKCMICGFTKFVYRSDKGMVVDQSLVPERTVLMPHDIEQIQSEINSPEEEQANKEIDEWLRNPAHFPVTNPKNKH